MFSKIDLSLRNWFSYIYRFLLVFYSFFYLVEIGKNYFDTYFYIISTFIYAILFYIFKKREDTRFRTILDYCYILLIIYNVKIDNIFFYFLIVLPLINSQNNSGRTNNFYGYICSILILLVLQKFRFLYYLPIIIIFFIDGFLRFRGKIRRTSETFFEIVDEFYGINIGRDEVTKIYKRLIEKIESFNVIKNVKIKYILCLIIKRNDDFALVNGSDKIIDYGISKNEELIQKLTIEGEAENITININKQDFNNTLYYLVKGKNKKYCFVVVFDNNKKSLSHIFKKILMSNFILIPAFKHLARIFEIQNWISINKNKTLEKITENQEYVLKANEVMHFVKNSMSPIKDSLTLYELYEKTTDVNIKSFLKQKFDSQRKNAKFEIENIIRRSDFILEKSKNPFEADEFEIISSFNLFDYVRKNWGEKIQSKKITISGNEPEKILTSEFNTNLNIIDLILINIFSNITKYSIGENNLEFQIDQDEFTIIFSNNMDPKKVNNLADFKKLIDYYNKNNRIEISKRKSHGFVHLRAYCETIDLKSSIDLTEDYKFSFQIKFKYYENSNI
jgi:hypothetical protein